MGNVPQPAVTTAEERQLQIWLTPHGFLKAAMEKNATAKKGSGGTIVSFTIGKFKINGTIDSQNVVTSTEAVQRQLILTTIVCYRVESLRQ